MPQDETGRKPDLSDLDSFAGVDELGAEGYGTRTTTTRSWTRGTPRSRWAAVLAAGSAGRPARRQPRQRPGARPRRARGHRAARTRRPGRARGVRHPDGPEARHELRAVEAELNQRWPETKIEPSLTRIAALLDAARRAAPRLPVIHVAGTNGKTSTARMIDSLLTRMGVRTGRLHQPAPAAGHRADRRRRPADRRRALRRDLRRHRPVHDMVDSAAADGVAMSKFEILTGMAFAAFADAPVEAAVIEVGPRRHLGRHQRRGRQIAVITPIGIDHVEYLGTTSPAIGPRKGGHHQARRDRGDRRAGTRGDGGAAGARGRGGRDRRPGGQRVRGAGA